jgi:mannose/fructose/N-acetylgalactosamine-specific phosphotransferase system component IIC
MKDLPEHQQILINELADICNMHASGTDYGKIDWTAFLTFLIQMIMQLGPILIPLIVSPPTVPTTE